MSLLAPLFLLGALAVGLPVLFHLIRRTTRERTRFSSLMFLNPSPPRLTRRSKLEHLLLLAIRCLAICLLAVGFARPFLKKSVPAEPAGAAKHIVVLLDTSASMRRPNLWADARARAESILRDTTPADEVAIVTFDRDVHPLVTFDRWNATPAAERIAMGIHLVDDARPSWASTRLGDALIEAAELLADKAGKSGSGIRRIVLISDLQEGSHLDRLQGYEWPKGVELSVQPVKARSGSNASIQWLAASEESGRSSDTGVRVRVANAADSKRESFKIGWSRTGVDGFIGAPVDVYVPPGQSRVTVVPSPPPASGADRIVLRGDDVDFDNTIFVVPPSARHETVLYFGQDSEKDPKQSRYFVDRAFQNTPRQSVKVIALSPQGAISAADAASAVLYIITDPLSDSVAGVLRQQILAGKTALIVLRDRFPATTLSRLCGAENVPIEEGRPDNYVMLANIDFQHPLFAPFADPHYSDFTKIHFWKYRHVDPASISGARVVARFDNQDPALLDVPAGKGRILILTSGWQPEDSQLALSTKFVPLLYATLDYSGAAPPAPAQYTVGDAVPLDSIVGSESNARTIATPDGANIKVEATQARFLQTSSPGVYSVGSSPAPARFVVNLDAAESRTAPMSVDEFERLGAPVAREAAVASRETARKLQLQNSELENRQKLWRWFVAATLAVLLIETWLAGRTARRTAVPEGGAIV